MNRIVEQDLRRIFEGLSADELDRFRGSTILLTGGAGFLGYYFINFFTQYASELNIKKVICLDNFQVGEPGWLKKMSAEGKVELHRFNVASDNIAQIPGADAVDYIYHMASIASPLFYRKYPIETLDANIWGLRRLLDFYRDKSIRGLVFYSSSEIYGDPTPENIPTPETYWGNVDCQGPRACYDEAKRFGETLCYLYHQEYRMPLMIVRPFNIYGPGLRLTDARVPADFAKAIYRNQDIVILSDGRPTRTFCYVSDAVTSDLKVMAHAQDGFDTFNTGMDKPEISVRELADVFLEIGHEVFGYSGQIKYGISEDTEYLTNNPNRRCPVIDKARKKLGYAPKIGIREGVRYYLEYIRDSEEEELIW